jgi:hypothetical protein
MKKARRTKTKLALEWREEKYSPPMALGAFPHTGETKIIRAPHPKASAPRQQHRPAA